MKKLIGLTAAAVFLMSATAASAFDIAYTGVSDDRVKVSADADEGSMVSLLVINDGYSEDDIISEAKAQQYFYAEVLEEKGFEHEFCLMSQENEKQTLKFVLNVDGEVSDVSWDYYPSSMKTSVITMLNSASGSAFDDAFDEALDIYGLSVHPLCIESVTEEASGILLAMRNSKKFAEDTSEMLDILNETLVVGAFNASENELLTKDGLLMYADVVGFDAELYADYCTSLTETGIDAVNSGIMNGDYKSAKELCADFEELVLYNLIMNNAKSGYGHVADLLKKYEDKYSSYGFDTDEKATSSVYSALVKSNASNLGQLAGKYNALLKGKESSKGSGGSGGGLSSGASSSLALGSGYIPFSPANESSDSAVFSDLSSVPWAQESVMKLYEKGIINGKASGIFAPGDTVTRAEFAKMLYLILNLTDTPSNTFADTETHWAKDYVAGVNGAGIVNGISETQFAPDMSITREQGAVMLFRAFNVLGITPEAKDAQIPDEALISDYALDAVNTLYAEGIIKGMADGSFAPQNTMTRAEAAVLICRLPDKIN